MQLSNRPIMWQQHSAQNQADTGQQLDLFLGQMGWLEFTQNGAKNPKKHPVFGNSVGRNDLMTGQRRMATLVQADRLR